MRCIIAAAALLLSAPFAASAPTATLEAMAIDFAHVSAGTSLSNWLGSNGTVTGGSSEAVASSVFLFSGSVMLDAGVNNLGVQSDDGFELLIDGQQVAAFNGNRGFNSTPTAGSFDAGTGGVFDFELLFWDGPSSLTGLRTTLNGSVIGMDDFVETAPIPLAAGLPLLAAGPSGLGGLAVRRRRTGG